MIRAVRLACLAAALFAAISLVIACSGATKDGFSDGDGGTGDVDAQADGGTSPGDQLDATLGDLDGGGGPGKGDGSLFSDASPDVSTDGCVPGEAGPPPYPQKCTAQTANECDGVTDTALQQIGVSVSLLNGTTGNGYDDDC